MRAERAPREVAHDARADGIDERILGTADVEPGCAIES
jgi:hypothetical protein